MFQSLMRRAQATIESSVEKAVGKVIMAVPFVIAAGFGAAALSVRLNREFGAETGNLLMAALFCGIGLIIGGFIAAHSTASKGENERPATDAPNASEENANFPASSALHQVDAGVMTSLAATLVPTLLPPVMRLARRNLPLVAIISAGAYVLSRPVRHRTGVRPPAARESAA